MDTQPQKFDFMRLIIIGLLLWLCVTMVNFVPLIPRAIRFMDDAHELRERSVGWQKAAEGIQKSLTIVEKLAHYFEGEARRKGESWPTK